MVAFTSTFICFPPNLNGGDEILDVVVEELGGEEGVEVDLLQVARYQLQGQGEAVQPRPPLLTDVLLNLQSDFVPKTYQKKTLKINKFLGIT